MSVRGVQQQQLGATAHANIINCWFVLDNSASMSGTKWSTAKSGVLNCIGQLTSNDLMGLLVFGSELNLVAAGVKKDANLSKFHATSANGSSTALYDAIIQSGTLALQMHGELKKRLVGAPVNSITYMILLTDGEDTSSKSTINDVIEFLKLVNRAQDFKIILAGVGLDSKASGIMRRFGQVGDNDIQFRELRNNEDIKQLFEHVTIQLTQTLRTLVVTDQGVVAVEQQRTMNLTDGSMSSSTRGAVMGVTGATNPVNNGGMLTNVVPDSTTPSASTANIRFTPVATTDFWDVKYDLNEYETYAALG